MTKKVTTDNKDFLKNNKILKNFFNLYFSTHKYEFENSDTVIFEEDKLTQVLSIFQSNEELKFEILIDIIAIDYSDYGVAEWNSNDVSNKGYSRGIKKDSSGRYTYQSSKKHFNQKRYLFRARG